VVGKDERAAPETERWDVTRAAAPVAVRALVVDDSPTFLQVAVKMLERDGITVVGTATTSRDAAARVAELRPEVALVDVHLAGESGLELARALATADAGCGVAVILMSTHSAEELEPLLASSPARGFVAKEDLSGAAVRDLLREDD
jgi:CheY-like chemotaxis protein